MATPFRQFRNLPVERFEPQFRAALPQSAGDSVTGRLGVEEETHCLLADAGRQLDHFAARQAFTLRECPERGLGFVFSEHFVALAADVAAQPLLQSWRIATLESRPGDGVLPLLDGLRCGG
jgi:hypothetical protein